MILATMKNHFITIWCSLCVHLLHAIIRLTLLKQLMTYISRHYNKSFVLRIFCSIALRCFDLRKADILDFGLLASKMWRHKFMARLESCLWLLENIRGTFQKWLGSNRVIFVPNLLDWVMNKVEDSLLHGHVTAKMWIYLVMINKVGDNILLFSFFA